MTPLCPVCEGEQAVELVRLVLPRVAGRGVARCPRCNPEPGRLSVRVLDLPMREDLPRGSAA